MTISNTGAADLTVTGLAITGGEFSFVSPPATPFTITAGGQPVNVTVRFSPTALGGQSGSLDITSDDPDEALVSVSLTGNGVTAPPSVAYRINAGGPDYTDNNGDLFVADKTYVAGDFGYVGGKTLSSNNPVAGTTDDPLYQDMRKSQASNTFSYVFDNITSGSYDITLYFAYPAPKPTVMDILVEGVLEVDDLDVTAAAGGRDIAYNVSLTVSVADGQLNIDFVTVSGSGAHISAIAVE
jgi:hypothetical protein